MNKMSDWKLLSRLGEPGKEGTGYLAENVKTGAKGFAKQFKKKKSIKNIQKEADFQKAAHAVGIAPEVYEVDLKEKRIIMETMVMSLPELIECQGGKLTDAQQERIIELHESMHAIGLSHNDANPLNIMAKNGTLYLIDFGMTRIADESKPAYSSIWLLLYDAMRGLITVGFLEEKPRILLKVIPKRDPNKKRNIPGLSMK